RIAQHAIAVLGGGYRLIELSQFSRTAPIDDTKLHCLVRLAGPKSDPSTSGDQKCRCRVGSVTEYGTAADETMSKDALVKKHPYFSKARYRCLHFARDWPALELCADGRFVSLAALLCSRNLQNVRGRSTRPTP